MKPSNTHFIMGPNNLSMHMVLKFFLENAISYQGEYRHSTPFFWLI